MASYNESRKAVSRIMKEVRQDVKTGKRHKDPDTRAWSGTAFTRAGGKPSKRLMIILSGKCCGWASSGGPCTMCNYWVRNSGHITDKNLINQFKNEIGKHDFAKEGIEELDVFTSGSFLNDNEVSVDARTGIFKIIDRVEHVKEVLIESRPEYANGKELARLKKLLKGKGLSIGIGLECSDDFVREVCINKGFSIRAFERSVRTIKKSGCNLLVYVIVKPPFLTERESIEYAVKTVKYVFGVSERLGIQARVAVEPVIIKSPSLVHYLWKRGLYKRVWLWSIIEIIRQVDGLGNIQVGVSSEGMRSYETPGNCEKCTKRVIGAIVDYNEHSDAGVFRDLHCECMERWKKALSKKGAPIRERVRHYIKEYRI